MKFVFHSPRKDKFGDTPLRIAKKKKLKDVLAVMREKGAGGAGSAFCVVQ